MTKLGTTFATDKESVSAFCSMIVNGYSASNAPGTSADACAKAVASTDWGGVEYLEYCQKAWDDIYNF